MSSVNKAIIVGRLGKDPEMRMTPTQVPVVTLTIATSDNYVKDGNKVETTEWHRVIVWNKQAENCQKYLTKGSMVYVEGRLQTRSWDDQQGQKRYTTEIIASTVQFLSPKGASSSEMPMSYANDPGFTPPMNSFGSQGQPSSQPQSSNNAFTSSFPPASPSFAKPKEPESSQGFDDIPF